LIGRALRAVVDLRKLGARTVWIDCDVLQADGGTRTAAITGSYVALALAIRRLQEEQRLVESPLTHAVAAVSVGMVDHVALLDLCYEEDVNAEVDMNLVMTAQGQFVELQGSGEEATFDEAQLQEMLRLGRIGVESLFSLQRLALGETAGLSA
jgi:ribonuclease PH